ncbi:MAG: hypothetical protein CW338_10950 [Clostridiales bacterium]|nr:hypothetical protein [Clostridiales bacterium]
MKKLTALLLAVLLLCAAFQTAAAEEEQPEERPETWAIYMYMCATDLETKSGAATQNLLEIMNTTLPDNVIIILETGGTGKWKNTTMNSEYLERWAIYAENGKNRLDLLEQLPLAPMSDKDTFEDFLKFACGQYRADHTMLLVWDHGGGTVSGACWDEAFPNAGTLYLREMQVACENVFGINPADPPIDIIGFDCCLMATIDVAEAFSWCARYLVASEETIPGSGWNYTGILQAFAENPAITPEELGIVICDTYADKYAFSAAGDTITLSLADLSKVPALMDAYELYGYVMTGLLYENTEVYTDLAYITQVVENFGGNSRAAGYTNLVDLYDFAYTFGADNDADSAIGLCRAIDDCVIYCVNGYFHDGSHGLSFFFPYTRNTKILNRLDVQAAGYAFKCFYSIAAGKPLSSDELAFMKGAKMAGLPYDPEQKPRVSCFANLKDLPSCEIVYDDQGRCAMVFGPEVGKTLLAATVELYTNAEDGTSIFLGVDDDVIVDRASGYVISNLSGYWPSIGGHVTFSCLDFSVEGYNIYSIPIIYNDDLLFMQRGFSFETGDWEDLGARYTSTSLGCSRSVYFKEGDPIQVLLKSWSDQENRFIYCATDDETIPYSEDLFAYTRLPDGEYYAQFVLEDVFRDTIVSKIFRFSITDGKVIYK